MGIVVISFNMLIGIIRLGDPIVEVHLSRITLGGYFLWEVAMKNNELGRINISRIGTGCTVRTNCRTTGENVS